MKTITPLAMMAGFVFVSSCGNAFAETGEVTNIDEPAGTITVKEADGKTSPYRPKDGLVFNALKPGDRITFSVTEENGQRVITMVEKR